MSVRKLKDSWWVDITWKGVRLRRRSPLNTRLGAQSFETSLRQSLAAHGSVVELERREAELSHSRATGAATFSEFAERWFRDYVTVNNKPSEQRNKRSALNVHLIPAFGHLPLAAITAHPIEQFKSRLVQKGLSTKTINNFLTILRKCLDTAVEWDELVAVPRVRQLKTLPPPFRHLSASEVDALLLHAGTEGWRTLILAAVRTGMRFGELAALRWDDIDFHRRLIHVRRSQYLGQELAPKNNRARFIPLATDLGTALIPYCTNGHQLVFEPDGRPLVWMTAVRRLKAICKAAGIAPLSWHPLRHTFASLLAERGASLHAIKELLGHSSITMTLRYAHLTPQTLLSTIALLEPTEPVPEYDDMGNRRATGAPESLAETLATHMTSPESPLN